MTGAQRIAPLPRSEWTEAARAVFGFWEGEEARRNGSRSSVMMALANHPDLAMPALKMGRYILTQSTLSERQKELIVLRIAWLFGCEHQWEQHCISAQRIGIARSELDALSTDDFRAIRNLHEKAIVTATDELSKTGRITEQTWRALAAELDDRGLMDLIYSVGFFAMNAWAMGALQLQSETDLSASLSAEELLGGQ